MKEKAKGIFNKIWGNVKLRWAIIVTITLIVIIGTAFLSFRHLFGWTGPKTIDESNAKQFVYSSNTDTSFYSYMDEILMYDSKKLVTYNSAGVQTWSYNLENVSNPVICIEGSILIVSQKGSDTIYVFDKKDFKYSKKITDATIQSVYTNKNGYMALTYSKSGYRTVIGLYKVTGEEIFNVFLTTSNVSTLKISDDNKYLAFAEVDTSKINASTTIKFVKLNSGDENNIIQTPTQEDTVLYNIEFYSNEAVICLFDKKISIININKEVNDVVNIDPKKHQFVDIDKKYYVMVEKSESIFGNSTVYIYDYTNKHKASYTATKPIKGIDVNDKTVITMYDKGSSYHNIWGGTIKTFDSSIGAKKILPFNGNKNIAIILADRVYILDM